MQRMVKALYLALAKADSSSAARIAMMAITTSNSINVNARLGSPSLREMICPGDRARHMRPDIALATLSWKEHLLPGYQRQAVTAGDRPTWSSHIRVAQWRRSESV